jgi:ABC-2 type transport system ATP-binding protein
MGQFYRVGGMASPVVETRSLTKHYGSVRGIEDITMSVTAGEVFGFLGPNGAGKTTLIRILLDLQRPTGGSALVFGLDARRESLAIRARLGNLPGDFTMDAKLSGRELMRHCAAVRGMDGLGTAHELAERFSANLERPAGDLSKGNRQKIGLVQALFHEPELLVLDEPTSGLDPLMQEEFLAVLGEHRDRGGTVFLSSHDLAEVERICDRVAIIRDGRLAAVEDVAQMRGRSYHRVAIEFGEPVDAAELAGIPGVSDLAVDGRRVAFRVHGDLDAVVKAAARHTVVDMELVEPTLEEMFLTYYADDGVAA